MFSQITHAAARYLAHCLCCSPCWMHPYLYMRKKSFSLCVFFFFWLPLIVIVGGSPVCNNIQMMIDANLPAVTCSFAQRYTEQFRSSLKLIGLLLLLTCAFFSFAVCYRDLYVYIIGIHSNYEPVVYVSLATDKTSVITGNSL